MYGYILCNNKQELNLSATDAVYEMHENNFLRSLTDLKSPALLHRGMVWGYQYASLLYRVREWNHKCWFLIGVESLF